jgi:hypothetical protein
MQFLGNDEWGLFSLATSMGLKYSAYIRTFALLTVFMFLVLIGPTIIATKFIMLKDTDLTLVLTIYIIVTIA